MMNWLDGMRLDEEHCCYGEGLVHLRLDEEHCCHDEGLELMSLMMQFVEVHDRGLGRISGFVNYVPCFVNL